MVASLIVSVYNQARNLELILDTVRKQTISDFEVVVADDGSSDNTIDVVEQFRNTCDYIPIRFVTQEDLGFRKTVILNKAIKASSCDYLVFIDGDMLLNKYFMQYHLFYRNESVVLCGHRGVKLCEGYTGKIMNGEVSFNDNILNLIWQKMKGNIENPLRGIVIRSQFLRKYAINWRSNLSGCNFSLYRSAIESVNGFDENILEHGYNDFELGCRLKNSGFKLIDVSKLCNTYHLYHKTRKTKSEHVLSKIHEVSKSGKTRCDNGLEKI